MLKAAVIGLGPHGQRVVGAALEQKLELAGAVDRSADAIAKAKLGPNVVVAASDEELYRKLVPDLVCICTNGPSHEPLAQRALAAGVKRVMVEKPMGCSVAECDSMIDAAAKAGARLAVDQSRRHSPLYRWLSEQIAGGAWGQVRHVFIQRPGIGLGCLATHSFDLVRQLTGLEVRRVTGWVDEPKGKNPRGEQFVDPGGLVVLELDRGVRGTVLQVEDGAGPMTVEVDLTAARVRVDERDGSVEVFAKDLSKKPGPGVPAQFERVAVPAGVEGKPSMPQMLNALLADLAGTGPLVCDAGHGRSAVEILVAAHLSHRRGNQPVTLPLAAEDRQIALPVT